MIGKPGLVPGFFVAAVRGAQALQGDSRPHPAGAGVGGKHAAVGLYPCPLAGGCRQGTGAPVAHPCHTRASAWHGVRRSRPEVRCQALHGLRGADYGRQERQDVDAGGSAGQVAWVPLGARFLASFSSFCFFLASSRWRFSYE